ncbi:MAG TPA: hypothetical protein VGD01_08740 [Candidatus Elarobacter sp.]|jgi:hypothetical protein
MMWQAWRIVALLVAVLGLALVAGNVMSGSATQGFHATLATPGDLTRFKVVSVDPVRDVRPDVHVGDVIRLHENSPEERFRYARQRLGDTIVFDRDHGGPITVRLVHRPPKPVGYAFLAIVVAFIVVGALLALRQPRLPEARALAGMLLLLGVTFTLAPEDWMPPWVVGLSYLAITTVQFIAFGYAVHLATIFPDPNAGGWRRRIRRVNVPVSLAIAATGLWLAHIIYYENRMPSAGLLVVGRYAWVYYLVAITTAFTIANRAARGADRMRVRWVSLSLAIGFSGVLVNVVLIVVAQLKPTEWMAYFALTILVIPLGLGYAIVRHRVIDVGFVINRAVVFGAVSLIVVMAFMALEWLLGSALVKVSHLTSTSLELGLALVLGFSLRTIHAKVDAFVDDIFFRSRHEAERALQTFARDVGFITDPGVALARAHDELLARTGAAGVGIYIVDDGAAVRVDATESNGPSGITAFAQAGAVDPAFAESADIDDPALVRLRASRSPLALREVRTRLRGDRAYPMYVRDALSGLVVLQPKTNGEAYAPDEIATIESVALALGNALDALQTAALKDEIARLLANGAPLDSLRRTVDAAAWVRGAVPQPARPMLGLSE